MTPDDRSAGEAVFNLEEAARVAGVSPSTLRRHKDVLCQYGANIGSRWQVPMSALIASGLMKRQTPPETSEGTPRAAGAAAPVDDETREKLRELERENHELRRRAEVAEAVARERAEALERADRALRMIEAGQTTAPAIPAATEPVPETPEPPAAERPAPEETTPRTSWWRRLWG